MCYNNINVVIANVTDVVNIVKNIKRVSISLYSTYTTQKHITNNYVRHQA